MLKRVGMILVFVGLAVMVCADFPWVVPYDPPTTAKEAQERRSAYQRRKMLVVYLRSVATLHWLGIGTLHDVNRMYE